MPTARYEISRLSEAAGAPVVFTLRALPYGRVQELKRLTEEADIQILLAGCVEPDLKAAALQEKFQGVTPAETVKAMLLPGEIADLAIAVEKLSSSDPIMAVSNVGDYLIGSAWGLASALGVVDVAHSMGKALPFVGKAIPNLDKYISFALFTVFLPLLLYGLVLAYYLPAIPFIRWISALVGWIILVVEALVAAPLWLCAHAMPDGEGAAGQHGKRGYFLLLGILVRPPLMVCGFFAAVILMNVVGRMLGAGFELFVGGTMQTKVIGITGTFSMLVILGIVVIMTANKFFSLIHYLPEHVTNWIGQQFHALGEKEDQAGVKNVFVGSTNAVSSGAHGARELRGDLSRQWNRPGAGLTEKNFRS